MFKIISASSGCRRLDDWETDAKWVFKTLAGKMSRGKIF